MKNYVGLIVTSDSISPEKISSQLDVPGDKAWRLGDRRKDTAILEKENGWAIYSKKSESLDIEIHIDEIKEFVKGYENNFKVMSDTFDCDIQLSCAIYCKHQPPLFFTKEVIAWLNDIGASLDIDIYSLS